MEFFDKIGKKASEAYKMTADKTGKIAKETRLKLKIGELKTQVNEIYEEIGKKVYEKHVREEDICIKKDLEEECTKIDVLSDEIESLLKQCLELKNKKQCESCHTQIEKEDKFCPKCGAKQTEEPPKEVEILEDLENAKVEENKEQEKENVKQNLESKIKNKENQEENSSDIEDEEQIADDIEENSENEDNNEDDYEENLKKTVAVESDVKEDDVSD